MSQLKTNPGPFHVSYSCGVDPVNEAIQIQNVCLVMTIERLCLVSYTVQ